MSNDNDDDSGVISLDSFRKNRDTGDKTAPKPVEHTFEFHLLTNDDIEEDVVTAKGFLKFGPQFLVVVSDYDTALDVVCSVALPMVKYVKRVDQDNAIQATLDLG